ncbi:MAG: hypothetical protein KDK03_15085 [Rhodobacteraceae bacterium]|nr:hypothetical protein [Paracoccaceae bacterium]
MPKFRFTHHRLDTRHWLKDGVETVSHTLELSGQDAATGAHDHAILIFDSGTDLGQARGAGTVGYMTRCADGSTSLVGWFPLRDFSAYHEVLAQGDELSVHFELRDPRADAGYLRRLGIGHYEKIITATICRPAGQRAPRSPASVYAMPL